MHDWSKSSSSSAEGTTLQAQGITCLKFPIFCKIDHIRTCKLKMFMIHTNVKTLFHNCTFPGHYNNNKTQKKSLESTHLSRYGKHMFFTREHIKNINKTTVEFILLQFIELIS